MRRIVRVALVLCITLYQLTGMPIAHGVTASSVVISQLSTGDSQSGSNEFVELYNNSTSDIDVSNWCIRYSTIADSLQGSPRYCFTPSDGQTKIYLTAHSYAIIVTPSYAMPGGSSPDGRFTGSNMSATGGHIKLLDSNGGVIDKVGWNTVTTSAVSPEGMAALAPSAVQSLTRKLTGSLYQDTDNNKNDFELKTPLLHGGGIYELRTPVDICGNLADIQEVLPAGYGYDEAGNCEAIVNDVCINIDKIQLSVPVGMEQRDDGSCAMPPQDVCLNLDGLQVIVPTGYVRSGDTCVHLEDRELWLSEILPNVSGSDTGREYIEIYNPQSEPITLSGYTLYIGKNFEKAYPLPLLAGKTVVPAYGFVTFSDSELGATLLNTLSGVRLVAPAGNVVSETVYSDPGDDQAWAYIDGAWQYTSVPTSGTANIATPENGEVESASTVASCPVGKYRNPLTNRCRTIEADAAILADCQEGYYRNPETNRCRKIAAAAVLVACQTGYTRNPETNRCRKDGTDDDGLTPCKAGQERNPATNRCRNVSALTTPASVAEAEESAGTSNTALPWVIGIAAVGAVGYGIYEWRHELAGAVSGLFRRLKK